MNRQLYAVIKPSGRYNGEKVTKMVKYCLNLILKLESYVMDTETKTWQIVCDNDMLIYTRAEWNNMILFYTACLSKFRTLWNKYKGNI